MSEVAEIKTAIETMNAAWTEFKKTDKQRDEEIVKHGKALAGTEEKLAKLDAAIAGALEMKTKLEGIELAMKRGGGTGAGEDEVKKVAKELKAAEAAYLRGRGTKELDRLIEAKAMSVNSDPDGGYLVTPDTSGAIQKRIWETSPMRRVAAVQLIATDALEGIIDVDEAGATWTAETQAPNNSKTPQLGKYRIPTHEMSTMPFITTMLLQDANVDPATWLTTKVADKFGRTENTAFVNGNGSSQPRGFLTYPVGIAGNTLWGTIQQVNSGAASTITVDSLIDLQMALKDGWRARASFAWNRKTYAVIRKLKDVQGRYYWEPSVQAGQPAMFLGMAINEFNDMPDIAANALATACADWGSAYQIVDRVGISVIVDPLTNKPYVGYYTRRRVGGDVVNFDAIKIGKVAP